MNEVGVLRQLPMPLEAERHLKNHVGRYDLALPHLHLKQHIRSIGYRKLQNWVETFYFYFLKMDQVYFIPKCGRVIM